LLVRVHGSLKTLRPACSRYYAIES
jgi:hypothetical protein